MLVNLTQIFCILLAVTSILSDDDRGQDTTYATLRSFSSESNEAEDRSEGRSLIGMIEKIKKVGNIIQTVGGKILPGIIDNTQSAVSKEFGQPKMRAIQIIHDIKKDVEDFTNPKV